jgi:hypothetical protein
MGPRASRVGYNSDQGTWRSTYEWVFCKSGLVHDEEPDADETKDQRDEYRDRTPWCGDTTPRQPYRICDSARDYKKVSTVGETAVSTKVGLGSRRPLHSNVHPVHSHDLFSVSARGNGQIQKEDDQHTRNERDGKIEVLHIV